MRREERVRRVAPVRKVARCWLLLLEWVVVVVGGFWGWGCWCWGLLVGDLDIVW